MLYDPTRCTGCGSCEKRCGEIHDRVSRTGVGDGTKRQCMQCVEPSCVPACPTGALRKGGDGIVARDRGRCVECGSCAAACTFRIAATSRCDLCAGRIAGGKVPACAGSCPSQALVFGKRADLIAEARSRQEKDPGRYHPGIYGETEGVGTNVLILSRAGVPFERLGLPAAGDTQSHAILHHARIGFPGVLAGPIALCGFLAAAARDVPYGGAPQGEERRTSRGRRRTDTGPCVTALTGNHMDPDREKPARKIPEEGVAK
jgi:Fe-S-cluster-containing dehydrogenase component